MSKHELDHYLTLLNSYELSDLMQKAREIRGDDSKIITYSKKVFIPLTELVVMFAITVLLQKHQKLIHLI